MDYKINKNNQANWLPWISPEWLCHFKTLLILLFLFCIGNNVSAQPKTITVGGTTYNLDGNDALKWVTILKSNDPAILARTFRRDANNTDDDQWTGGSADPDLVNDWYWVSGNTNDKGDISNAGVILIGKVIYFFGDRTAVNGDAQIAFWFFQSGIQQNCTKGKGGFRFSGANADGDVLGISNFINGGGSPSITVYKRTSAGTLVVDNSAKTWLAVNNKTIPAPNTSADANWKFSHTDACTGTTGSDFWTFTPKSGANQTYPAPLFFEGAIDFSTETGAKLCFNRFLLETRNSQSLSASLQDFVAGEFNVTPLPPTVTGDEKCFDKQPVTLTASCSSNGSSPRWYKKNTDGTYTLLTQADGVSADGSSLTKSGLPVGTTTFYATCYNASLGCESDKKAVDAIIDGLPSVDGVVTEGENANSIDDGITKISDDIYEIRISKTGVAHLAATGSGGSGGYTYAWQALDANAAIDFSSSGANGTFTIKTAVGLNASYSFKVTVTDSKNCQATDIVEIRPRSSCPPCGIIGKANACKDESVTYKYGNPADETLFTFPIQDYTLTWTLPDGSTVSNQSSVTVKLTATGTNTVSISFKSTSGLVDNCPGCNSSTEVRQVTCTVKLDANTDCFVNNGKATVTPTGGYEPYTYLWDNGETTQQATKLSKGKHTVTVTDANKCTTTCDVTIPENPCQHIFCTNTTCLNFIQSTQILPNICYNTSNGTITPGVFYYWGNVTAPARNFTIKVTQTNTCGATFFQLGSGNQFNLQSGTTCSNDGTTSTFTQDASGAVTVSITGAQSGKLYILGIKYGAKSGATFTSACTFTFDASTTAGGTTAHVDGSTGQITVALNCSATCVSAGANTITVRSVPKNVPTTQPVDELQVHAYPNPFNSIINFNFVSPVSGKARLEVFDLLGRKLANVYQGDVEANMQRSIPYKVPSAHMVPMIYKLTVGERSTRGTLLPGNQEP